MFDPVTLLDRAPAGFRRFAYRVAAGKGVLGRLTDAVRFRFSESEVPVLPKLGDAAIRLTIGPANSAGQAFQWARAAERHLPGVNAVSMHGIGANVFVPEVHTRVPVAVYQRSPSWHSAFEAFLASQTHVIWESGLPLLGRRYGSNVAQEIALLRDRGVHCALLFHGSDIRLPSRHAAQSPWSPFRDTSTPVRSLEEGASRNAALAEEVGVPVFVSTPDLLQWLPDATWCPVVVDGNRWRTNTGVSEHAKVPVVVHAPSQKWLKGTDRIEPTLRSLSLEGVIDYRQIVGVPHAAMPSLYAQADIVLDQFRLGSYGVTACEAMASGRLVMGHVDESTRAQVQELTGRELPVHESTIDSLEADLRRAASEPEVFNHLRTAGPAFVEAVHDGRRSARAIAPFLGIDV